MDLSNAPSKLVLPFANAGGKNVIPTASQIGITAGAASLTDGFPPLTRTPIAAGGVPPSGLDMNGVLFAVSAIARWLNAGGGFNYDATFAADANVDGYPAGARVLRTDGRGYWLNMTDGNTTDPESAGAAVAGWVPDLTNGIAAVAMTSANVTLTPLQYGKPVVVITGVLTANLNLIFPSIVGAWYVINNTTGAFTITAKTAAGTGVVINRGASEPLHCNAVNMERSTPTRSIRSQSFVADGTFTVPPGVTQVSLTGTGGGGGGGGTYSSGFGAGGGGSAGSCIDRIVAVNPGDVIAVTIGGGGSGGGATEAGTAGGSTSFGGLLSMTGGAGGKSGDMGGSAGNVSGGSGGVALGGQGGEQFNPNTGVVHGGMGGSTVFGVGGYGGGTASPAGSAAGYGAGGGGGGLGSGGGGAAGFLNVKW